MTATQSKQRIRTCVSCGAKQGKTTLMRIVRTADGVIFDPSGRLAGRGAYVCNIDCLRTAYTKGGLNRALKMKVCDKDFERIENDMQASLAG